MVVLCSWKHNKKSEKTPALSSDGEFCWDLKMENISQVLLQMIGFICYPVISQSCSEQVIKRRSKSSEMREKDKLGSVLNQEPLNPEFE